ncbi:hypothetical protein WJX79_009544 [Trebouxia sp. C0005]
MGSARFFDSNNKKHFNARYLVAHIRTHEGYSSAVPPEWLEDKQPDSRDLRKLLSQEPVTAVSLPFATQLIASNSYSPVEPITTAPVPAAFEVTVDTLEYTDLHSKGGTLLQICYCSICYIYGLAGSTDAQKQAHWQEHYMAFYATNSCGKETKADEVLLLYEMRLVCHTVQRRGYSRHKQTAGHGHRGLHDIMATLAKKTDQKASTGV